MLTHFSRIFAEPMLPTDRDYSTISPSARSLLLTKGMTRIPYARKAAELMVSPEEYVPELEGKELAWWGRAMHFEERYQSIDRLLSDLTVSNILELSSGFSFRGLDKIKKGRVHYIDTDLPAVMDIKQTFVQALSKNDPPPQGLLELCPLNALEKDEFNRLVDRFEPGAIAIVNEGLLMYLGMEEKEKLCRIIRKVLEKRGGCWITADIYIKRENIDPEFRINDRMAQFFEQHRIRDNMFDSFEAARAFFERQGLVVDQEAVPDPSQLSSLQLFYETADTEQKARMEELFKRLGKEGRIRVSWRLKPA